MNYETSRCTESLGNQAREKGGVTCQEHCFTPGVSPVHFELYPLNVNAVDHTTATAWARKELAGAAIHREWTGEDDEEIHIRGKVFPHFYRTYTGQSDTNMPGYYGVSHLDIMDNMRKLGEAHVLMRADGWYYGWFVIERLTRGHSFIAMGGVGQEIAFEATFQRVPVPDDPSAYLVTLWGGTR